MQFKVPKGFFKRTKKNKEGFNKTSLQKVSYPIANSGKKQGTHGEIAARQIFQVITEKHSSRILQNGLKWEEFGLDDHHYHMSLQKYQKKAEVTVYQSH